MGLAILEITALLSFLIIAAKGPTPKKKFKYTRPCKAKMSDQYVVNRDGQIEEY